MITSPQPFSIGEVARYILAAHLNLPPETEKTVLLKTWETMRKKGSDIPVRPRSILFRVPEIRPPSRVKEYSRLALSGDVGGLMSLLDGKSNADAAWALEALKSLDNENLEELFHVSPFFPVLRAKQDLEAKNNGSLASARNTLMRYTAIWYIITVWPFSPFQTKKLRGSSCMGG